MTTYPIHVNAWDRADVSFAGTGISQSIEVDPRGYQADPAGAADAAHAVALARRAEGQRVVFRPWMNLNWGDQPRPFYSPTDRDDPNAWLYHETPFVPTDLPAAMLAWDDAFNARCVLNGTNPDYIMLDNEAHRTYYYAATEAQRQTYFEIVTVDDPGNPYPGETNPYLGSEIWKSADPLQDQFIQENEQFAYEDMRDALIRKHRGVWSSAQQSAWQAAYEQRFGSLPEGGEFLPLPMSNYKHTGDRGFDIENPQNKPGRMPLPEGRVGVASAPVAYYNRRDLPLFQAEPGYSTTRQVANRQRWKSIIYRVNDLRASAIDQPGDVHPWIQAPGWGWNATEAWANATQLPFELLLFRVVQAHYEAMGISTYNLWNPIAPFDPNTATTHPFLAAYFTGRTVVGELRRDLPKITYDSDEISSPGISTAYADVFEIATLFYTRSADNPVPFLTGLGTAASPLVVSEGTTGDAQVAAMKAAIESNQGTTITTEEVGEGIMPVQLVKQATTTPVDDPTIVAGSVGDDLSLIVALRNTSGSSINTFAFVEGEGVSAAWESGSPPLSIPNNQQQNIVLTFDTTEARDEFDTTFQVTTSGDDPTMNIQMNIAALAEPEPGKSRTIISQRFPITRLI